MRTGFCFTVLIFGAGLIFGLGYNAKFTKEVVIVAYDYGHQQGAESVLLSSLNYKPPRKNPGIGAPLVKLASAK